MWCRFSLPCTTPAPRGPRLRPSSRAWPAHCGLGVASWAPSWMPKCCHSAYAPHARSTGMVSALRFAPRTVRMKFQADLAAQPSPQLPFGTPYDFFLDGHVDCTEFASLSRPCRNCRRSGNGCRCRRWFADVLPSSMTTGSTRPLRSSCVGRSCLRKKSSWCPSTGASPLSRQDSGTDSALIHCPLQFSVSTSWMRFSLMPSLLRKGAVEFLQRRNSLKCQRNTDADAAAAIGEQQPERPAPPATSPMSHQPGASDSSWSGPVHLRQVPVTCCYGPTRAAPMKSAGTPNTAPGPRRCSSASTASRPSMTCLSRSRVCGGSFKLHPPLRCAAPDATPRNAAHQRAEIGFHRRGLGAPAGARRRGFGVSTGNGVLCSGVQQPPHGTCCSIASGRRGGLGRGGAPGDAAHRQRRNSRCLRNNR